MSLQMAQFHSFLRLSNIALCICTTSSLSISLSTFLFIHTHSHLGYFHVLAMVNSAAVNIGVHVSFGSMVLAQKQKYGPMEQDSQPKNKPIHLWVP